MHWSVSIEHKIWLQLLLTQNQEFLYWDDGVTDSQEFWSHKKEWQFSTWISPVEECVCRAPEPGLGAVLCNVTPARGAGWQVWRAACVGYRDVNVSTIFPSPVFISPIASPGPWHAVKVATCPYKYHHHLYCQSHKVPVAWALNIRNIKLLFSAPCILWPLPAATDCPRPDSFVRKCSDYGPWTS